MENNSQNNQSKLKIANSDPTLVQWTNFNDYRFVEYQLKYSLTLKNPVHIIAIHSVKNSERLYMLEEEEQNTNWVYGWFTIDNSKYPEKIGELKTKGYTEKRRRFYVDQIPIHLIGNSDYEPVFCLCKLFIGNSLAIRGERKEAPKEKKYPDYYNSIKFLSLDNLNISIAKKDIDKVQTFDYEVFKNYFIAPLYVIKFSKLKQSEENKLRLKENFYCSKCQGKEAEVFCFACEEYFDKECYTRAHSNKIKGESHGQPTIIKHKQKQGYCSEHEERVSEFYCITCQKPICSRCKIILNHKTTEHSHHKTKELEAAYEKELPKFSLAEEIRKRAVNQFYKIKDTIKLLVEKQVQIEKEIDYEFSEENECIQCFIKEAKLKNFSIIAELNEIKRHLLDMDDYFQKAESTMLSANLIPQALWIQDNYEEVITDMFSNFSSINTNYQITPESFNEIKQTELRITKRIQKDKQKIKQEMKYQELFEDSFLEKDNQAELTKKLVSLKEDKKAMQDEIDFLTKQNKAITDFDTLKFVDKYMLEETTTEVLNIKAQELKRDREKQKEEDERNRELLKKEKEERRKKTESYLKINETNVNTNLHMSNVVNASNEDENKSMVVSMKRNPNYSKKD